MFRRHLDPVGTGAIIIAVILSSFVPLFLKIFTGYIDAWTSNGLRYTAAMMVYIPWLIHAARQQSLKKHHWRSALIPALFNTVHQILWALAPYFIDAGLIGFLIRLSIFWAVAGSFILFADERKLASSHYFWIGAILSIGGFVGIALGGTEKLSDVNIIGITMLLGCSILWAGYTLSIRFYLKETDVKSAFGMVSCMTGSVLLTLMFAVGSPEEVVTAPPLIRLLIPLSGLFGIALYHALLYTAIKRLGVAISTTVTLSSAFLTALWARIILSERLASIQWIFGIILIIGSGLLILAQQGPMKKPVSQQEDGRGLPERNTDQ
jgi:drug/metabolite transporter (DMT)-like permease